MNISLQTKFILFILILGCVIVIPDLVFAFCHSFAVCAFEILEGVLDEVIEHIFDTDRHTTQLIVFYLMWGMLLLAVRKLWISLKTSWSKTKTELLECYFQAKHRISQTWTEYALEKKLKWLLGSTLGACGVAVLLF